MLAVALVLCTATTGCMKLREAGLLSLSEQPCAPDKDGKPKAVPALLAIGNARRDEGLRKAAYGQSGAADEDLAAATYCYSTALSLAPDNYEASLGLGVANLGRARLRKDDPEDALRRSYIEGARRSLGKAYMVRQGPYEPLYYLAEVAVLQKDLGRAQALLAPIEKAGAKAGPVHALQGYLAYESGAEDLAKQRWRQALDAGWPQETVRYVAGGGERDVGVMVTGIALAGVGLPLTIAGSVILAGCRKDCAPGIALVPLGVVSMAVGVPLLIGGAVQRGPSVAQSPTVPTVRVGLGQGSAQWEF
ncbi:MAG: hypothetical protein HY744_07465 [Deltaproteobacteria bacterium]|nr:hypothetical protein [Deltaproteobacteria bacterium]